MKWREEETENTELPSTGSHSNDSKGQDWTRRKPGDELFPGLSREGGDISSWAIVHYFPKCVNTSWIASEVTRTQTSSHLGSWQCRWQLTALLCRSTRIPFYKSFFFSRALLIFLLALLAIFRYSCSSISCVIMIQKHH